MFEVLTPGSLERVLDIEIQNILVRVRPQPHGIDFLATFVADPGLDQVLTEDPTLEQKMMVLFEVAQRFVETARQRTDFRRFLRLEIV